MKIIKNKLILCILLFYSFIYAEFSDTLSYYQKFDIALHSFKQGRFRLSQAQFSDIINSKESYEPTSLIMFAKSLYSQKKYDEAENIIKSELQNFNNSDYLIHAQILLSDIYLSKGNFTSAFRNYLSVRPAINDSINLNKLDESLILCISNGLKENLLENILMKEKNSENRSIINLSRAYQSWLNGDNSVITDHIIVNRGGHDWFGVWGNMDINSTAEIWKFFSQYDINGKIKMKTRY